MKIVVVIVALAVASSGQRVAQGDQDSDRICAMAEQHYDALRSGDIGTLLMLHVPEFTFFGGDGGLLWTFRSLDEQRDEFDQLPRFYGGKPHVRYCTGQVHGNVGIVTYYVAGAVTTGVTTTSRHMRVTEVWVRDRTEWKVAHHHESALLGSVTQ
jgi:ketosteroid isomerase-like protein